MRCGKKPRKTVKIFGKLSVTNLLWQQDTKILIPKNALENMAALTKSKTITHTVR